MDISDLDQLIQMGFSENQQLQQKEQPIIKRNNEIGFYDHNDEGGENYLSNLLENKKDCDVKYSMIMGQDAAMLVKTKTCASNSPFSSSFGPVQNGSNPYDENTLKLWISLYPKKFHEALENELSRGGANEKNEKNEKNGGEKKEEGLCTSSRAIKVDLADIEMGEKRQLLKSMESAILLSQQKFESARADFAGYARKSSEGFIVGLADEIVNAYDQRVTKVRRNMQDEKKLYLTIILNDCEALITFLRSSRMASAEFETKKRTVEEACLALQREIAQAHTKKDGMLYKAKKRCHELENAAKTALSEYKQLLTHMFTSPISDMARVSRQIYDALQILSEPAFSYSSPSEQQEENGENEKRQSVISCSKQYKGSVFTLYEAALEMQEIIKKNGFEDPSLWASKKDFKPENEKHKNEKHKNSEAYKAHATAYQLLHGTDDDQKGEKKEKGEKREKKGKKEKNPLGDSDEDQVSVLSHRSHDKSSSKKRKEEKKMSVAEAKKAVDQRKQEMEEAEALLESAKYDERNAQLALQRTLDMHIDPQGWAVAESSERDLLENGQKGGEKGEKGEKGGEKVKDRIESAADDLKMKKNIKEKAESEANERAILYKMAVADYKAAQDEASAQAHGAWIVNLQELSVLGKKILVDYEKAMGKCREEMVSAEASKIARIVQLDQDRMDLVRSCGKQIMEKRINIWTQGVTEVLGPLKMQMEAFENSSRETMARMQSTLYREKPMLGSKLAALGTAVDQMLEYERHHWNLNNWLHVQETFASLSSRL